jgi:hypothetical protein
MKCESNSYDYFYLLECPCQSVGNGKVSRGPQACENEDSKLCILCIF